MTRGLITLNVISPPAGLALGLAAVLLVPRRPRLAGGGGDFNRERLVTVRRT